MGIQDSLQRGLRRAMNRNSTNAVSKRWEFRTRFREDCDLLLRLRHSSCLLCGNSGLASERIATVVQFLQLRRIEIPVGIQDSLQRGLRQSNSVAGDSPNLFVGIQDSLQRGLRRTRLVMIDDVNSLSGNSGLASERIAT